MAMDVDVWIHGHTHETYERRVAGTRLVTNPAEKTWDNAKFDPHFVVEL